MSLQRIITWFVEKTLYNFIPSITYTKTISHAIDPKPLEDIGLSYEICTPLSIKLQPGQQETINTGLIFQYPLYLGLYIVNLYPELEVREVIHNKKSECCIEILLINCSKNDTMIFSKGKAIARLVFHVTIRTQLLRVSLEELCDTKIFDKTLPEIE